MTDESTLDQGGSTPLPESNATTQNPPRSDAEASLQHQEVPQETAEQKTAREDGERRKNRTKEYIDRQNKRIADLAAENERLKASSGGGHGGQSTQQASAGDKEPTLEEFDYDISKYNKAHAKWSVDQAFAEREKTSKQAEDARKQQEISSTYIQRVEAFAAEHPDFAEAVGSIPFQLSNEVQAAIMTHEKGPEIAYHLANNDDDAFNLSNVLPHVAAAAVERLAKRLSAAPAKTETDQPVNQLAQSPAAQAAKPITRAPQPTPTVSGRAASETPPEKLTDDEWYRRDLERRRKR